MRERTAQLLLLCGGLIVSCLLAEAVFYLLNRAAATYPVVVYATDKPGTELWCYDDKFQGKADWDLRLGHPYRELSYRSNMDFDSTLIALDPLAVSSDAIQDEATGAMNAAIHDLMHYREAFFRRSYGSVLDAIPSQTLRFFAARKLRDKISEETLACVPAHL